VGKVWLESPDISYEQPVYFKKKGRAQNVKKVLVWDFSLAQVVAPSLIPSPRKLR